MKNIPQFEKNHCKINISGNELVTKFILKFKCCEIN